MTNKLQPMLNALPLKELKRIEVALEGDWSSTVTTVWSREEGFIGFAKVTKSHPSFRPSMELYFDGMWLGIHCFKRIDNRNLFDEELADKIIQIMNERVNGDER